MERGGGDCQRRCGEKDTKRKSPLVLPSSMLMSRPVPRCGGRLGVITTVQIPVVVRTILAHLGLSLAVEPPGRPPPRSPPSDKPTTHRLNRPQAAFASASRGPVCIVDEVELIPDGVEGRLIYDAPSVAVSGFADQAGHRGLDAHECQP